MLILLRERNIALLWIGGLISLVGDWVLLTALPYYVYQLTHSLFVTAAITVLQLVPYVLFGSLVGVFIDRWDRKTTLIVCNLIQGCVVLLLMLVSSTTWLAVVYVVVAIQATVSNFVSPAQYALLPRLVIKEQLSTANSLFGLCQQLARLSGPPIGGALLALGGINPVVIVDSASFLVVAGMLVCLRQPSFVSQESEQTKRGRGTLLHVWTTFWNEWIEGWRLIRASRVLMSLLLIMGVMTFGGTMIDPLYPAFFRDVLHAGPIGFGWIHTAQATGGIVGGLVVGRYGKRLSATHLLAWGNLLVGVLLLIQYNIPLFPVAVGVVLLIGPEQVAAGVALQTLLQTSVDNRYQGRIFGAIGTTGALCSMLGASIAGPLGQRTGVVAALNVAALCTLLAAGLAYVVLRNEDK